MAFYIHIGCELSGHAGSVKVIDRWIHQMPFTKRIEIMGVVLDL